MDDADLNVSASVGAVVSDIIVTPASLAFNDGNPMVPTRTTHRFWSGIAEADYFFANAAAGWYIQVISDKVGADGVFGTLQNTAGDNMELRIWQAGYGPSAVTYPDIDIDNPPPLNEATFWDANIGGVENGNMCVLKLGVDGGAVTRYFAFDTDVGGFPHEADPTANVVPFRLAVETAGCPVGDYTGRCDLRNGHTVIG
jgi:hypothetical protein